MNAETQKRLDIATKISASLEGKISGIMLSGSMGYGQHFSVTPQSDIDLVIVTDTDRLQQLCENPYFQGKVSPEALDLFQKGQVNSFLVTQDINNVETNMFVYEKGAYYDFCLLESSLRTHRQDKPIDTQTGYGFDGTPITFDRNVTPTTYGFIYEKPVLADGKYWGGVPRQDFFYTGISLYQEDDFFSDMVSGVWKATLKQLVKEYPKPDLSKTNILNTHYTYQTARERLPQKVVDQIQQRTKEELNLINEATTEASFARVIYGSAAAINYGLAMHVEDWKKFGFLLTAGFLFTLPAAYYHIKHKSLTK